MNKLPAVKQAAILKALTEGCSIRGTARMVGVSTNTVLKLLVDAGELCALYQDHKLRNLPCKTIEADEIWAYCRTKERNATKEGDGDVWTFTAICADPKLIVSWVVGDRAPENAHALMHDLAHRVPQRVQITTDAHRMYPGAVEAAFGWQGADHSSLIKHYASDHGPGGRYSPPVCTGLNAPSSWGTRTLRRSRRPTLSGRTSPCGWAPVASRGSPTRSPRRSRTMNARSRSISCTTTSAGSTRR